MAGTKIVGLLGEVRWDPVSDPNALASFTIITDPGFLPIILKRVVRNPNGGEPMIEFVIEEM